VDIVSQDIEDVNENTTFEVALTEREREVTEMD